MSVPRKRSSMFDSPPAGVWQSGTGLQTIVRAACFAAAECGAGAGNSARGGPMTAGPRRGARLGDGPDGLPADGGRLGAESMEHMELDMKGAGPSRRAGSRRAALEALERLLRAHVAFSA